METIEMLNRRLIERYGQYRTDKPWFQLRMSNTIVENQYDTFIDFLKGTDIFLREVTETRRVKPYGHIDPPKWILERLIANPNPEILVGEKLVYASIWVFGLKGDVYGEPIEPKWIALEFVIDNLLNSQRIDPITGRNDTSHYAKYIAEGKDKNDIEGKTLRVNELIEALYGGTDKVGDALVTGNAISLPNRDMEIKL